MVYVVSCKSFRNVRIETEGDIRVDTVKVGTESDC
jgi:hypothetical protein